MHRTKGRTLGRNMREYWNMTMINDDYPRGIASISQLGEQGTASLFVEKVFAVAILQTWSPLRDAGRNATQCVVSDSKDKTT